MAKISETDLYAPVKAFLERLGYEVKSEVGPVDVVGRREDADPVIVELKVGFSLVLLQQAVARQSICDAVYVAVPRWKSHTAWRSFKANVGALQTTRGRSPVGASLRRPRADSRRPAAIPASKVEAAQAAVLSEFERREGDPNQGGTRGSVVTAYRQEAERCAAYLVQHGPTRGAEVAKAVAVPNATRVMAQNHYGWFVRDETRRLRRDDRGARDGGCGVTVARLRPRVSVTAPS